MLNLPLAFRALYRKVYRAIRVYGLLGTLRLAREKLRRRLNARPTEASVSTFDKLWNVQTDGNEDLSELRIIDRENYLLGNRYGATSPETFAEIISSYPFPCEECVFVDCGSGKGRVLLLASEFPFRRIIGVEFASDLNQIAKDNLTKYTSATQKCKDLEVVCADATTFSLPPAPTVLFMANPFEGEVMQKFLGHVEKSLYESPRPFFVLYRNPRHADLWDKSTYFVRVRTTEQFIVYKTAL